MAKKSKKGGSLYFRIILREKLHEYKDMISNTVFNQHVLEIMYLYIHVISLWGWFWYRI